MRIKRKSSWWINVFNSWNYKIIGKGVKRKATKHESFETLFVLCYWFTSINLFFLHSFLATKHYSTNFGNLPRIRNKDKIIVRVFFLVRILRAYIFCACACSTRKDLRGAYGVCHLFLFFVNSNRKLFFFQSKTVAYAYFWSLRFVTYRHYYGNTTVSRAQYWH